MKEFQNFGKAGMMVTFNEKRMFGSREGGLKKTKRVYKNGESKPFTTLKGGRINMIVQGDRPGQGWKVFSRGE